MNIQENVLSRRSALSAAVLAGGSLAMAAIISPAPSEAAVHVFGTNVGVAPILTNTKLSSRWEKAYQSFAATGSKGLVVVPYAGMRYLIVVTTAFKEDVVQVFNNDTGRLIFTVNTPGHGSGNLVYAGAGLVYFSSKSTLMRINLNNNSSSVLEKAKDGVTSYMNLQVDYKGFLWATTYPLGGLVKLDPKTGRELYRTGPVGKGNQYTKGLDMSADKKTIFFGTGTADPDLWYMRVDRPGVFTRLAIPGKSSQGFIVYSVQARGRKVFVWYNGTDHKEKVQIYDTISKKWVMGMDYPPGGRIISEAQPDGTVYFSSRGRMVSFNCNQANIAFKVVKNIPAQYKWAIHTTTATGMFYAFNISGSSMTSHRCSLSGANGREINYAVRKIASAIQSMVIHPKNHTAYFGGYRGNKMTSVRLANGLYRESPATGTQIHQIEGMHPDGDFLYIGSYGHAKITKYDINKPIGEASSYKYLGEFYSKHKQDRPFAWTSTKSKVVFGTVPVYGYSNGAVGVIDRATDKITLYDQHWKNLSVIGLAGEGDIVYGGTSILTGYGSENNQVGGGNAEVFAFNVITGAMLWRTPLTGVGDAYGPVIKGDKLYYGTTNTVVEVDKRTGKALRTFKVRNTEGGAGWKNIKIAALRGTEDCLIHVTGGSITVVDVRTNQLSRALGDNQIKPLISFDQWGSLWIGHGEDIVKAYVQPQIPHSMVRAEYNAQGGLKRFGHPVNALSPNAKSPDGGHVQSFVNNGKRVGFYNSPKHGTKFVELSEPIGILWAKNGHVQSVGMPWNNPVKFNGGQWQEFKTLSQNKRSFIVTTKNGTYIMKSWQAIGRLWLNNGREKNWGWPITAKYKSGTEVRQKFSNRSMAHWTASRGVWVTRY